MMCRGGNTAVIDALEGREGCKPFGVNIDLSLTMHAINDPRIRVSYPRLRAALVELLKGGLYIFAMQPPANH